MIRRPPADVFFETEGLCGVLEAVRTALAGPDAPAILVEGPPGAGKTAFLRRLARSDGPGDACWIEAEHPLGADRALAAIGRSFGTGDVPLPELAEAIAAYGGSALPFLVVDDAHNLSPFALRVVLDLRRRVRALGSPFALVMAAPPGALDRAFGLPSLMRYAGDLERTSLPAFSEDDTREYLLRTETSPGGEEAIEGRARALHRASGGLPGEIRRMADALRRGVTPAPARRTAAGSAMWRDAAQRAWALPAAVGGLTLGVGFYLAWSLFQGAPGEDAPVAALPSGGETLLAAPAPPPPGMAPGEGGGLPDPVAPVAAADTAGRGGEAQRTIARQGPAPRPAAADAAPESVPESAPESIRTPPPPEPPPRALTDHEWLMAQDPQRYMIQLASTPDRAGAEAFIERHPLQGRTIAVENRRGGRATHVVLHGSFASSGEARRAIEALPSTLRRNDPFARGVASVQEMAGG